MKRIQLVLVNYVLKKKVVKVQENTIVILKMVFMV